jgi:putative endonuclease
MHQKKFFVYILTNKEKTVFYSGVTNDLEQRIIEHYTGKQGNAFTTKYRCYYLLFYEAFEYVNNAIAREKEIKGWRREKKLELIKGFNPGLNLLNEELFGEWPPKELTSR